MFRPLDQVTVVECADDVAAACAGRILADLGADVVKVEPPHQPTMRHRARDEAAFRNVNAGKRSLTLDTTTSRGWEILLRLCRSAEVLLIGSGRPETIEERIDPIDGPRIVVAVTPFGLDGPYGGFRVGPVAEFHSTGEAYMIGDPGHAPLAPSGYLAEMSAGVAAATSTLMALFASERTHRRQLIDISIQEVGIWHGATDTSLYLNQGVLKSRENFEYRLNLVACKDGYLDVLLGTDVAWHGWCEILGRPALKTDSRFLTSHDRAVNRAALVHEIEYWAQHFTREQIIMLGQPLGLTVGPVLTVPEVLASPQYRERGFFQAVEGSHELCIPGLPFLIDEHRPGPTRVAPQLGEHTADVLRSLGIESDEVDALRRTDIV